MSLAGRYTRMCSCCKITINYSSYKVYWKAKKNNSVCRMCFYKSLIGRNVSEETRLKIGNSNRISLIGNVPSNKGKPMSKEQRKKLSKIHTGMKHSSETKEKLRIKRLIRLKALGIGTAVDVGSQEFFKELNKKGYDFKPKRFFEIGYDADGYDENKHIWCEFDTPYHNFPTQKLKDEIRQTNIIEHFEKRGNPLKEFLRVSSDKFGNVIKTQIVYKGGL